MWLRASQTLNSYIRFPRIYGLGLEFSLYARRFFLITRLVSSVLARVKVFALSLLKLCLTPDTRLASTSFLL